MQRYALSLSIFISACTWTHFFGFELEFASCALQRELYLQSEKENDKISPNLSLEERIDCARHARVLLDPPPLHIDELHKGPEAKPQISPEQKVYCRFINHYANKKSEGYNIGDSLKFRCLLTDETNQLLDKEGRVLIPQDEAKAVELKVKYIDGNSLATMKERHREGFIEIAASRIFWALGIPADRMYPAKSVVCFGCSANPFPGQETAVPGSYEFVYPALEFKYPGAEISIGKKAQLRIPLADGKSVTVSESEWAWEELANNYATYTQQERREYEALLLLANWIGYRNPAAYQNRIHCLSGSMLEGTSVCRHPVFVIQDIGATFGDKGFLGQNPRGDYKAFFHSSVFKDDEISTCTPEAGLAGPEISEAGRLLAVERLKNLNRTELEIIFKTARFDQVDPTYRKKIRDSYNGKISKEDLNAKVIEGWVDLMEKRKEEILSHRCKH